MLFPDYKQLRLCNGIEAEWQQKSDAHRLSTCRVMQRMSFFVIGIYVRMCWWSIIRIHVAYCCTFSWTLDCFILLRLSLGFHSFTLSLLYLTLTHSHSLTRTHTQTSHTISHSFTPPVYWRLTHVTALYSSSTSQCALLPHSLTHSLTYPFCSLKWLRDVIQYSHAPPAQSRN